MSRGIVRIPQAHKTPVGSTAGNRRDTYVSTIGRFSSGAYTRGQPVRARDRHPSHARTTGKKLTSITIRRFWWTGSPACCGSASCCRRTPGYKVRIEGHTDTIGDSTYNNKLGMARASAVRDFLIKYGARASQIDVSSRGKLDPKYAGQKDAYVRTDEARWMNRRVALTVLDDQGRTVGAGGAGDAIRAIQPAPDGGARGLLQRGAEAPGQTRRHRAHVDGSGGSE